MKFLKKLFGGKVRIDCPRCLGKGFVNETDIKRLGKELMWRPGPCAYCNAKGKVDPGTIEKVSPDLTYLTTDLSSGERQAIINNDQAALERAYRFDVEITNSIHQIIYLYFTCKLDTGQIAEFYLLPEATLLHEEGLYRMRKDEMVEYVKQVIASNRNSELN